MQQLIYSILLYTLFSILPYDEKHAVIPTYTTVQPIIQQQVSVTPAPKVLYTGHIEHLFFHPLIAYPKRAFRNDYQQNNMDDWFVTITEFNKILQSLYDKQFILININDIYEKEIRNGKTFIRKKNLYLPKGKKPLVLSIDDVNYYNYMKNYGVINRIILDKKGNVAALSTNNNGENILSYNNDIIPLLDMFVKKHPDFSLNGAKGMLNVTGFNGLLGYKINQSMRERNTAIRVIKRLKETGWYFASHSYGHPNHQNIHPSALQKDIEKWEKEIRPLVGPTQVYVYPYGSTLTMNDEKLQMLLQKNFYIFLGVGKESYEVIYSKAVFIDRRHADGIGLRHQRKRFLDLYDAQLILDTNNRPQR
ncbi:polysaccharide deacetylase family protein [Bacillus thuringiensis]|nr:polysaccharide deacetylase family protein [Bacillus thuringiensis]MED2758714.1 polysaccharide deacetylase family protein [Bacillus thuringiensis]MED2777946.1 polysaccharide deacetylase family protein [Bacillus thuringiensis]